MRIKVVGGILAGLLLLSFQNCSQARFGGGGQVRLETLKLEDGQVFDGKLRILHHYADGFTCKGVPVAESILVTEDQVNWTLIQNSKTQCFSREGVAVQGVNYDESTQTAVYNNKIYVPPRPYHVDASADPNSSDSMLLDGVCANSEGQCSLRAAVEQAVPASVTEAVIVHVPPGQFALNEPLKLMDLVPESREITIRGAGPGATILDGSGVSPHFEVRSTSMKPVNLEGFTLQNGHSGNPGIYGSAITFHFATWISTISSLERVDQTMGSIYPEFDENLANPWKSELNISNCVIKNSTNSNVVFAGPLSGNLNIRNTQFLDNSSHGVYSRFGNSLTVEDSLFLRQGSRGVAVDYNKSHVVLRRSAFNDNYRGIDITGCIQCQFEEIEVSNNKVSGLYVSVSSSDPTMKYVIKSSRIFDNSTNQMMGFEPPANLVIGAPTQVEIYDSTISMSDPSKQNCAVSGSAPVTDLVHLFNSSISDSSCGP